MNNDAAIWLLLIFLVLVYKDFGPPDGRTTVYFAYCADPTKSAAHCAPTQVGPSTVFRALPESQAVVSLEDGAVYRLHDCTVLDGKNWSCSQPGFAQSMSDGEYSAPWEQMTTQKVSWLRWEWLQALRWSKDAQAFASREKADAAGWVMALLTIFAAFAMPSFIYRRLNRRFPWMLDYFANTSGLPWRSQPARVAVSGVVAVGLVVTGFAVLLAGLMLYDFLAKL